MKYNLFVDPKTMFPGKQFLCNHHLYDLHDFFIKNYNYKTINFDMLFKEEINEYLINMYEDLPENLLMIGHISRILRIKLSRKVKISVMIDDLHYKGRLKENVGRAFKRVDKIFATYGYCFYTFFNKLSVNCYSKVYFMPHSARYKINYNENPKRKILLTGALTESQYPNRMKMYNISQKEEDVIYMKKIGGYRCSLGSNLEKLTTGAKYIKKLGEYICCFTDDASVSRPYIVAKHFEILSSGSLLLSCNPHTKKWFEKLGIKDGIHYISCTPENMNSKVINILNPENVDKINKIREEGYKLCLRHHMYENRGERIKNLINMEKGEYLRNEGNKEIYM